MRRRIGEDNTELQSVTQPPNETLLPFQDVNLLRSFARITFQESRRLGLISIGKECEWEGIDRT